MDDRTNAFTAARIDFESVYEPGSAAQAVGNTGLPWDVGVVQPAVVELEGRGRFSGEVLDLGCGLGNNSVYLADRGHTVTAVDSVAAAVEDARVRAGDRPIRFAVADATVMTGYEGQFDSILDSMLHHAIPVPDRPAHARALFRVARPGARLSLLTFTDDLTGALAGLGVRESDLRAALTGAGWNITALTRTTFLVVGSTMPAGLRSAGIEPEIDVHGRTPVAVWQVEAERG